MPQRWYRPVRGGGEPAEHRGARVHDEVRHPGQLVYSLNEVGDVRVVVLGVGGVGGVVV
jgi:hypothetical protein